MSTKARAKSEKLAVKLGYPVNPQLPPVSVPAKPRLFTDVFDRTMCLLAAIASSYNFPRAKATEWLEEQGFLHALTRMERLHLDGDRATEEVLHRQEDALYGLMFGLSLVMSLDPAKPCPGNLPLLLPNLKVMQTAGNARSNSRLRPVEEILAMADLYYCLHWGARQMELEGRTHPTHLPIWVIEERRRALEWVLGNCEWDDPNLDT